jgi:hypothetical protein
MADRFAGEITIGGKVPAALLEEFLAELNSTGASIGGYDGPEFGAQTAEQLRKVLDESGHLFLVDDQARYGQFEQLEAFLCEHGIPFDRHSEGKYEFKPENVGFRPGMKKPLVVQSDNDGNELLNVERVRPMAKELAQLATGRTARDKLLAAVVKTIRALNKLLPPEIEPLPPLEIME